MSYEIARRYMIMLIISYSKKGYPVQFILYVRYVYLDFFSGELCRPSMHKIYLINKLRLSINLSLHVFTLHK